MTLSGHLMNINIKRQKWGCVSKSYWPKCAGLYFVVKIFAACIIGDNSLKVLYRMRLTTTAFSIHQHNSSWRKGSAVKTLLQLPTITACPPLLTKYLTGRKQTRWECNYTLSLCHKPAVAWMWKHGSQLSTPDFYDSFFMNVHNPGEKFLLRFYIVVLGICTFSIFFLDF